MNLLPFNDRFQDRHIGPNAVETAEMLAAIGVDSLETLIEQTIPAAIRSSKPLEMPEALSEFDYLRELKQTAKLNKVFRSYMGQGYYGTITPSVILRNVFQNPGWYTQYTPYQAEIAQGRLEAILNFQTMVADLTGLPIANASLLDEGTAAAEAMTMFFAEKNKKAKTVADHVNDFWVDTHVSAATLDVLKTRSAPLGIHIRVADWQNFEINAQTFGILLQYPNATGAVEDYRALTIKCNENKVFVTVAADILSLALLTPPGEWGADCVVGNSQRFGVPMGFGGPHAAFFATKDAFKRQIPGRIIGVSTDTHGKKALRMALQTREQHIRREKATSNICTAQALLAIMASMYAVYHGSEGIKNIATKLHSGAVALEKALLNLGFKNTNAHFFDTLSIEVKDVNILRGIKDAATKRQINFWYANNSVQIALDETVSLADLKDIVDVFESVAKRPTRLIAEGLTMRIPEQLTRETAILSHPIFNVHHTESKMMRYIKRLENKDLSLMHSMIALGSCTMKLNAASELIPVSWEEFANIHPFAPSNQTKGYQKILNDLSDWLCDVTGFDACSLQPNSGAQGEYAGLLAIRA